MKRYHENEDIRRKIKTPPARKPLIRRVQINKFGKQAQRWQVVRALWFKNNPPNEYGWYVCGICKNPVHFTKVTLDHILPRSRRPDLRYEPSNLQPAHWICNSQKGSKVLADEEDEAIDLVEHTISHEYDDIA
jgi:5-methylcytosine-specific restriction endonuclease McrA